MWANASVIGSDQLRVAVEAAGAGFDPKDGFPNCPIFTSVIPALCRSQVGMRPSGSGSGSQSGRFGGAKDLL